MQANTIWRPIALATLVCGTLDILFAVILTLLRARDPATMLRFVASGPFPQAPDWGAAGAFLGLAVHFTLMAIMVLLFVMLARWRPHLIEMPVRAGIAYGLVTFAIMNLVIVPLRFPDAWPPRALGVATQLFAHIVLVGLPTAFIARRYLRG